MLANYFVEMRYKGAYIRQGRSKNLKEVPKKNFFLKFLTMMTSQLRRHIEKPTLQKKKVKLSSLVITDVTLAS